MPGVASLRQARYYAHPRNAFWPIAAQVLGFDPAADYARRLHALQRAGVALWDVLRACERPGSLDADIRGDTLVPNDFAAFLREHPRLVRVCFNGAKAASLYRRHALPNLADRPLQYVDLPSTSPAHAAASFDSKLAAWREALTAPAGQ
ncbi:DNA-deoxyinosine glycosylase [Achromobacter xylosoxidans]